jgi:hypothetical protein
MASVVQTWVGNLPTITDTIVTGTPPVPYNLTGATVRFKMRPAHFSFTSIDAAATVVNAALGQVSYQMVGANTSTAGNYAAWWEVTSGGNTISTPEFNVNIDAHAPLDFTASGPTAGPCAAWITGIEVDAFCSAGASQAGGPDFDFAALMASQALYEISGRQFSGSCSSTVRPCAQSCGCWGGGVGSLAIAGAVALGVPINWTFGGGQWECGGNSCGCGVLSEVLLEPYPVTSITQVKIGGVVQAASTYRLDAWRRLVCTNGNVWPVCQDLTRQDTDQGTWSVSFTHGMEPPLLGKQAACQLACQLKIAMDGGACQLPEAVTRVVRQGVTLEKGSLSALMKAIGSGTTGLALIDTFLATYNPLGMRRRPAVWSPDSPRYPRRVN